MITMIQIQDKIILVETLIVLCCVKVRSVCDGLDRMVFVRLLLPPSTKDQLIESLPSASQPIPIKSGRFINLESKLFKSLRPQ